MKKTLLFLLIAIACHSSAQLSGTALLPGQNDHSGIKVKFIAKSSTALTDSTSTNSNGTWSANISSGLYSVVFSKTGYRNLKYQGGAVQLINNSMQLDSVILLTGLTHSVNGIVHGTWETEDTYVVTGDLTIPFDSILQIEPGVKVVFSGYYSINAIGSLLATGTNDNKILFSSMASTPGVNDWKGLIIQNNAKVLHCIIEYCSEPLITYGGPWIAYGEIRKFGRHGVQSYGKADVHDMAIHDYSGDSAHAVICNFKDISNLVRCNYIYNGSFGIGNFGSGIFENNVINNISPGYGMAALDGAQPSIRNNIIHSCSKGILIGSDSSHGAGGGLICNTLYDNNVAIEFYNNFNSQCVQNIVVNNTVGIQQTGNMATPGVSCNLVWNNSGGDFQNLNIPALGQKVSVNGNGDSIDTYYNLFMDPLFENGFAPFVSSQSPCNNAAMNLTQAYYKHIGAQKNECFVMQLIAGIKQAEPAQALHVYPNPFNSQFSLVLPAGEFYRESRLTSLAGIEFGLLAMPTGNTVLCTPVSSLPPGFYILQCVSNKRSYVFKILKE